MTYYLDILMLLIRINEAMSSYDRHKKHHTESTLDEIADKIQELQTKVNQQVMEVNVWLLQRKNLI